MAVHENDIEILSAYLDGELPVPECEGLWRRLAVEPELTAELDRLRTEHSLRQSAWQSLEPTERTVAQLEQRIFKSAKRNEFFSVVVRSMRFVSSVAALVLCGFAIGWMGHNRYPGAVPSGGSPASGVVASETGAISPAHAGKFMVSLHDANGHIFSMPQQYDTIEEAQKAADDLERMLNNRPTYDPNQVVPAMDRY